MLNLGGGADSDIVLDILTCLDADKVIHYVWFNTGIEYQATKDHLKALQEKYKITIETGKAKKPIPVSCREYGQPFVSKMVSEYIERLQRHNFKWEDKPLEELVEKYPKCLSALKWWTSTHNLPTARISNHSYLKEFMIENPPTFRISNKCCQYAKKDVAKTALAKYDATLNITGVRKYEGGARAALSSCYSDNAHNHVKDFRPIFWYTNADKEAYEKIFGVVHSKCYTEYGLKRTGCVGCPYGRDLAYELDVCEHYEPNLRLACNHIFADSYEYTFQYKEFARKMQERRKNGIKL